MLYKKTLKILYKNMAKIAMYDGLECKEVSISNTASSKHFYLVNKIQNLASYEHYNNVYQFTIKYM